MVFNNDLELVQYVAGKRVLREERKVAPVKRYRLAPLHAAVEMESGVVGDAVDVRVAAYSAALLWRAIDERAAYPEPLVVSVRSEARIVFCDD